MKLYKNMHILIYRLYYVRRKINCAEIERNIYKV